MTHGEERTAPAVLELRVHGVNNTTPAALLDLPPEEVGFVAGDKLGSFWEPTAFPPPGARGHVPDGVRREAYSWGGMVRTTPNFGGLGAAGAFSAILARVLYALILPFSIGNAVQWSRRLPAADDSTAAAVGARIAGAMARLFGLSLTLLFTTTVAVLSLDVLAAQCVPHPDRCAPIGWLLTSLTTWSPPQVVALFALGPVAAVGVLWGFSHVSRQRYDVLPPLERTARGPRPPREPDAGAPVGPASPSAVLSQPGFWSNRITGELARMHLAASVALVIGWVALHAAMRGYTGCEGLGNWGTCVGAAGSEPGFQALLAFALVGALLLVAAGVVTCLVPTMDLYAEDARPPAWPRVVCGAILGATIAVFAALLLVLALARTDAEPPLDSLYGSGFVPLAVVSFAALLSLSGILWRWPLRGRARTAWYGCGPAVFMTVALVVAVGTSAIVVVMVGDWLNGGAGASELLHVRGQDDLHVPSSFVAFGAAIVTAAVVALIVIVVLGARSRSLSARAAAWSRPAVAGDTVLPLAPGVLPLSQDALLARVTAKRVLAARLHLVEPATGVLTVFLGLAVASGIVWTLAAYGSAGTLTGALTAFLRVPETVATGFIDVAMWSLGALGLLLVVLLASGATSQAPRPLGIVWDIACYLPRTGHPFGPPSFAERAVPEIAGRLYAWLSDDPSRRAVLSAHSMGGVLSVSALGLLASTPATRSVLPRVSLLTFGVQLRAFFGRMLPELLGPDVLGTTPSRGPRLLAADPWAADVAHARSHPPSGAGCSTLRGTLLEDSEVRWVSLWRLTDFLGFTAMAPVPTLGGWRNGVDRYASEIDTTSYAVSIGTHGEYFRQPEYAAALHELGGLAPPG